MTISALESLYGGLHDWIAKAREQQWLDDTAWERFAAIERHGADRLFQAAERRPLLIGFFGGTGVGKSSLLNRLAGAPIARVGATRPTSREVTLYLHESHDLAALPPEFPVRATHVVRHNDPKRSDVAWIDMPDVDSVETENRKLVDDWLPYVDWIVYVVNPERYRDDVGWQLLRARSERHHWLFVMNQYDLGSPEQKTDFQRTLAEAGFAEPAVLATSCVAGARDDFAQLEATIDRAIAEHGLAELKRIGVLARIRDLQQLAVELAGDLGGTQNLADFVARHRAHATQLTENLLEDLRWPIQWLANQFPGRRPLRPWRWSDPPGPSAEQVPEMVAALWTDQSRRQLRDITASAGVDAHDAGLPTRPAARLVAEVIGRAEQRITDAMVDGLHRALARPGNPTQRLVRRIARVLLYLLPLAATGWAGYHVVSRYQQALSGSAEFLGVDFAVHSFLLLGLAWLLPYLVYRLLEPSARTDACRGLLAGTRLGIRGIAAALDQAYSELAREHGDLLAGVPEFKASTGAESHPVE